ncbi:MAG: HAD-IA family hydrolase [Akkermansiaceae bacterium]
MKHSSLVFDFDGTLADTLDESVRIYNELAQENGHRVVSEDELPSIRNMKLSDFLSHVGVSRRRVPKLLYHGAKRLKKRITSIPLIEGVDPVIRKLRSQCEHFGILTSNSVENVELFLEAHGLDDVFTFVSSTSKLTGKSKHLRSICRTFSMQTTDMVYVGDEIRDVKAAKKARVPVAAVSWGFNSTESLAASDPDYLLHHPDELFKLV